MTATSVIAVTTIVLEVLPVMCHRLITHQYHGREVDSIIVSSDPIKVREKQNNSTTPFKLKLNSKPQKRSFEGCSENDFKCLYGESEDKENNNQIVDRFLEQYSNVANVHVDDVEPDTNTSSENYSKSYWHMIDSQTHHHPYDDKKGWVTLEPVPWSTSKISKWHPNRVGVQQETGPWGYGPTTQRPVHQFWVSGSSFHTQRPTSQWGVGTNDIITDNKSGGFPSEHNTQYSSPHSVGYRPETGYYEYSGDYKESHQSEGFNGNQPSKLPQNGHPSTYPNSGNGEWILLSTTKSYSVPQRHRWAGKFDVSKANERYFGSRKVKPTDISRYHEEDLGEKLHDEMNSGGNRKSDENVSSEKETLKGNSTKEESEEANPVQVLYTEPSVKDEPVKTFKRKVRLQVLPSLEGSSTSHGGLLEVDSKIQTIDEAQKEDEKLKKLTLIANIKKNKIRGYKLIPVNKVTGKGMNHKSAVTLAAVGAGMIPATMALLVPMALGRKKRSVEDRYPTIFRGKDTIRVKRW